MTVSYCMYNHIRSLTSICNFLLVDFNYLGHMFLKYFIFLMIPHLNNLLSDNQEYIDVYWMNKLYCLGLRVMWD